MLEVCILLVRIRCVFSNGAGTVPLFLRSILFMSCHVHGLDGTPIHACVVLPSLIPHPPSLVTHHSFSSSPSVRLPSFLARVEEEVSFLSI